MKKIILSFLLFCCFSMLSLAQEGIQINSQTVIKDEAGKRVSLTDFMTLVETKQWTIEPRTEEDGTNYIQLVKLTAAQQSSMTAMKAQESQFNGGTVPYFNMIDRDGNLITSDNTKGKVVVFNFWFTSCPPCIAELPELNELYEKYKEREDLVFAAITFEKEDKIARFLTKYTLDYPIVGQQGGFSQSITRGAYPTNVIIDKDGNIVEYISGGMRGIGKQIEIAIEAALQ